MGSHRAVVVGVSREWHLEAVLGEPLPLSPFTSGVLTGTSPDDLVLAGENGLVFQTTCP